MFSRFFIERPIFAAVVAIILCLAGLVSMTVLPVQQYPAITPVQVTVQATYPGADSKTLADSVASPIEAQINGVDNMLYMSSTSSANGQLVLTVYFSLTTDPDIAQVQVQNRVNLALPALPEAVQQQGVSVQKKSSSIMMLVAVTGKGNRYSADYVANYANVYVLDALKRVPGAGQAQIMGVPDQAMRIWMNPDRMASLGITTSDIANAVNQQNALFGAGQIGQQPSAGDVQLSFPVVTQGQFTDPRQYERIILRANPDGSAIVRLGDVARAEIGLRQYIVDSQLNREPATFIAIYQQPGANGLVVSNAVRKALDEMKSRFPEGLETTIALDTNDFVRLSIEEVIKTLAEALVLVVLVVYLFLQSFRTTLICAVAIIVSLVATFSGMLALGFSINLLTLFGLILAIGMVVDDAIVVCENVERNMVQHHLSPQGRDDPLDGRDRQLAGGRRAGDGLGVHPRGLPARHHRAAVQAVRHHHRRLGDHLRLRRADADAGDVCAAAQAHAATDTRLLRLVQPSGRPRHARLRPCGGIRHQAHGGGLRAAGRVPVLDLAPVQHPAQQLRAAGRPGLRDGGDHHAAGRQPGAHTGGGGARRRHPGEDPRRGQALDDHRLQPGRRRLQDQRGHLLHHLQGLHASATPTSPPRRSRTHAPSSPPSTTRPSTSRRRWCCRSRRRPSPASAPPAASSSGSRTPPPARRWNWATRCRPSWPRRGSAPNWRA